MFFFDLQREETNLLGVPFARSIVSGLVDFVMSSWIPILVYPVMRSILQDEFELVLHTLKVYIVMTSNEGTRGNFFLDAMI